MKLKPVNIQSVQPHNISLAQPALDYIAGRMQAGDYGFFKENPVRILKTPNSTLLTEDGDHRLFSFYLHGMEIYPYAKIYDLGKEKDISNLAQFRKRVRRDSILGPDPSPGLVKNFNDIFPEDDSYYVNFDNLTHIIDFIQEKGVYNPSDLKGRYIPDNKTHRNDFEIRFTEFLHNRDTLP